MALYGTESARHRCRTVGNSLSCHRPLSGLVWYGLVCAAATQDTEGAAQLAREMGAREIPLSLPNHNALRSFKMYQLAPDDHTVYRRTYTRTHTQRALAGLTLLLCTGMHSTGVATQQLSGAVYERCMNGVCARRYAELLAEERGGAVGGGATAVVVKGGGMGAERVQDLQVEGDRGSGQSHSEGAEVGSAAGTWGAQQ